MSQKKKIYPLNRVENMQLVLRIVTKLEQLLQNNYSNHYSKTSIARMTRFNCSLRVFTNRALECAEMNPVSLPAYMNVRDARKNLKIASELEVVHSRLNRLLFQLRDAISIANMEAEEISIIYYKTLKENGACGSLSRQMIINELDNLYNNITQKRTSR